MIATTPFEAAISSALAQISPIDATRRAYRRDVDLWLAFCLEYRVDPRDPQRDAAAAWIAWLTQNGDASTTRGRRISSLSSIYRELRRGEDAVVTRNPFSADDGPRRERVAVGEPTPLATPELVKHAIGTCDGTPVGIRDAAILRVLWSTGIRRVSLLSMTHERLQRERDGHAYVATVLKKGGDTQRILIARAAKFALDRWLEVLRGGSFTKGPIWRELDGTALTARELNRALERRAPVGQKLSPHMLRVSFLTFNPAGIDAKQDAAGHADPSTTQLYDRAAWRGREAFEQMPEIEDL